MLEWYSPDTGWTWLRQVLNEIGSASGLCGAPLTWFRAVEALDRIHSTAARAELERVVKAAPETFPAQFARQALERWKD